MTTLNPNLPPGKTGFWRNDPRDDTARGATRWNACGQLVHCSQEMSHLATFLPKLYEELGEQP